MIDAEVIYRFTCEKCAKMEMRRYGTRVPHGTMFDYNGAFPHPLMPKDWHAYFHCDYCPECAPIVEKIYETSMELITNEHS